MEQERRIAIFTGSPVGPDVSEAVEVLVRTFPRATFLVVVEEGTRKRNPRRPTAKRRGPVAPPSLDGLAHVQVKEVEDLHGATAVDAVRVFRPWLGISVDAPMLHRRLFTIPELGTINVHKSLLPNYRGMPPAFWELHDEVKRSGASAHWIDESLGTGRLICRKELLIHTYATVAGTAARLDTLGLRVLRDAVQRIASGSADGRPQGAPTTPTRSRPGPFVRRRVRRRLARRRLTESSRPGLARRCVKLAVMLGYVHVWAPMRNLWRRWRGRCHATVLLYHRVSDEFLDTVTVGVEQFQRQLEVLARRYDVLDLPEFLAARGKPRRRPAMVITFDDGYADNLTAARLMRRLGLPATFFVSTRIVDSELPFAHDLQKLGRRVPTLTWAQINRMARWGFHISNHTMHHMDLSALPEDEALDEISGAREDLIGQLGAREAQQWLAFPFGVHITEGVRHSLRALGVEYCFAGYGGVNRPDFDPLDIGRCGINHGFSALAFRAQLEGLGPRKSSIRPGHTATPQRRLQVGRGHHA